MANICNRAMRVKLRDNNVKYAPQAKTLGAAGMDLVLAHDIMIRKDEVAMLKTGVQAEIPEGHFGLLAMRSSIEDLTLTNGVGIIDSDYRGEIMLKVRGVLETAVYKAGDRIAQLVIIPYVSVAAYPVSDLSDTERGAGGFGSTGKGE